MKPNIRRAKAGDALAIAMLRGEWGREYVAIDPVAFQEPAADGAEEWVQTAIETGQDRGAMHLVGVRDRTVIGYASAAVYQPSVDADQLLMKGDTETVVHVDALMVTARERRTGVARSLMAEAERWGRSQGATRLVVIAPTAGGGAVRFYEEGLGFDRITTGFSKRL